MNLYQVRGRVKKDLSGGIVYKINFNKLGKLGSAVEVFLHELVKHSFAQGVILRTSSRKMEAQKKTLRGHFVIQKVSRKK